MALVINPLSSTPEMKRWALELTRSATNDFQKAQKLFDAICREFSQGSRSHRTAKEAYAARNEPVDINCQENARLYVALARSVGLQAFFTEVFRDFQNESLIHACAAVLLDGKFLLADMTQCWFGVPHKEFVILDDVHTVAAYLSQQDDSAQNRIAVKLAPNLKLPSLMYCIVCCSMENLMPDGKAQRTLSINIPQVT